MVSQFGFSPRHFSTQTFIHSDRQSSDQPSHSSTATANCFHLSVYVSRIFKHKLVNCSFVYFAGLQRPDVKFKVDDQGPSWSLAKVNMSVCPQWDYVRGLNRQSSSPVWWPWRPGWRALSGLSLIQMSPTSPGSSMETHSRSKVCDDFICVLVSRHLDLSFDDVYTICLPYAHFYGIYTNMSFFFISSFAPMAKFLHVYF